LERWAGHTSANLTILSQFFPKFRWLWACCACPEPPEFRVFSPFSQREKRVGGIRESGRDPKFTPIGQGVRAPASLEKAPVTNVWRPVRE